MKWISKGNLIVFVSVAAIGLAGCKKDSAGSASSGSSDPSAPPTPGVVDQSGGFNIKVKPPTGANYYIHLKDDFDKACNVSSAATSNSDKDIICTIEVEELEGKFHGIEMVLNVPQSMCKYVLSSPYFYYGKQWGYAPTAMTINVLSSGALDPSSSVTGSGGSIAADGTPRCDYDYQPEKGPNCCIGETTITKTTGYGSPEASTAVEIKDWGGTPGNCAAGAGMSYSAKNADSGLPKSVMHFSTTGFSLSFNLPPSIEIASSESFYYTNYFVGAIPAAFMMSSDYPASRYFSWLCLDDAAEIKSQISVEIREWNEMPEFELGSAGNPDTGGTETYWGSSINDWLDWDDFKTSGIPSQSIAPNTFPGMPL